jgi:general stress protein 26
VKRLKNAKEMIKENSFCVLSTCRDNLPNSSLMQYVRNEAGTEIYMLALKASSKCVNILNNPNVSLLVDTRSESAAGGDGIKALTAYGLAEIIGDEAAAQKLKERLVEINPGLAVISESPDACVIKVKIESFLMLEGVAQSRFSKIEI